MKDLKKRKEGEKMIQKGIVLLSALLMVGSVASGPVAASAKSPSAVKIAVVDLQKALQSVEEGQKARTQLEAKFNKKRDELQKEEASIKKLHEELQKQSMVLNEQALGQKQAEIQQRIMQFQEKTQRSQAEIQQKEQQLTEPILNRLQEVISEIAKENGYTLVLEKGQSMVLFNHAEDDLTDRLVAQFNNKKKK
jgi:outer membrane protein